MSNITTVYNQIRTELATLFPDAHELAEPDRLLENPDNHLRDGFGIKVGLASPEDFTFEKYLDNREITIVFTREFIKVDTDLAVNNVRLDLLEDTVTLKQNFLSSNQIGVMDNVQLIELGPSTEVNYIQDSDKYLTTSVTLIFKISETILT